MLKRFWRDPVWSKLISNGIQWVISNIWLIALSFLGGLGGLERLLSAQIAPIWLLYILVVCVLGCVAFGLWIMFKRHVGTANAIPDPNQGEPQKSPLQIIFGTGENFETKKAANLYQVEHTFGVAVRNGSSDHFLSNCKLYMNFPSHDGSHASSYLLVDAFTLNATEERLRPIVSYREADTVSNHSAPNIQFQIPLPPGGFYGVGTGWPFSVPVGAYTFTLRATSKETAAREVVCKAWVDEMRKLHFELA